MALISFNSCFGVSNYPKMAIGIEKQIQRIIDTEPDEDIIVEYEQNGLTREKAVQHYFDQATRNLKLQLRGIKNSFDAEDWKFYNELKNLE